MSKLLLVLLYSLLQSNKNHAMKITGGKVAAPHSRRYMALIKDPCKVICGGTLIQREWVLTAAHCEVDEAHEVILGAHRWQEKEREQQKFEIIKIIPHADFNRQKGTNDIMLVKIKRKAKLNKFVSILPLPSSDTDIKVGHKCSIAGWGSLDPDCTIPSGVLREADLSIIGRDKCNKIYWAQKITITENMLCAGPLKNTRDDACMGDSGGPLICGGKYTGIISFGKGCGETPNVFTRLTRKYINWIEKTINESKNINPSCSSFTP